MRSCCRRFWFDLADFDLRGIAFNFGARVRIALNDNREFERTRVVPLGAAGTDFEVTKALVREKFLRECSAELLENGVESAFEAILGSKSDSFAEAISSL
ncbi:MAG: hypothetical protein NUW37_04685 [Planctomycetes bacterium]|nr:hypothetical protein [Planctomycetota bacterium]